MSGLLFRDVSTKLNLGIRTSSVSFLCKKDIEMIVGALNEQVIWSQSFEIVRI